MNRHKRAFMVDKGKNQIGFYVYPFLFSVYMQQKYCKKARQLSEVCPGLAWRAAWGKTCGGLGRHVAVKCHNEPPWCWVSSPCYLPQQLVRVADWGEKYRERLGSNVDGLECSISSSYDVSSIFPDHFPCMVYGEQWCAVEEQGNRIGLEWGWKNGIRGHMFPGYGFCKCQ